LFKHVTDIRPGIFSSTTRNQCGKQINIVDSFAKNPELIGVEKIAGEPVGRGTPFMVRQAHHERQ